MVGVRGNQIVSMVLCLCTAALASLQKGKRQCTSVAWAQLSQLHWTSADANFLSRKTVMAAHCCPVVLLFQCPIAADALPPIVLLDGVNKAGDTLACIRVGCKECSLLTVVPNAPGELKLLGLQIGSY
jgi:hypothetical protein